MSDRNSHVSHFYVSIDGTNANEDFMASVLEICVENSLHMPDMCTIQLQDPSLRWVDDASLMPGKGLVIKAKDDQGTDVLVFDGELVELEPEFQQGSQRLVVRAFDRLHRLDRGKQVRSFQNVTDGDLVNKLAQEVGLKARCGTTSAVHEYVLQANETNLQFLQGRAARLGFLLYVSESTLVFEPPEGQGSEQELTWGEQVTQFRPRLSTLQQINKVTALGWDPEKKEQLVGKAEKGKYTPEIGVNQSASDLAKSAFNLEALDLVSTPARVQKVADELAQAAANRHAAKGITAEGLLGGTPGVKAGSAVQIKNVGERFSGKYFVTGSQHIFRPSEGYTTAFSVSGLQALSISDLIKSETHPGRIPSLAIGVVTDNQDPKGQGRVKVMFPWLSADHTSDWARTIALGAGAERGIQFLPEVGDEVLVGFEMGDINYPYVLGGLWNGKDAPPEKSDTVVSSGKVNKRIIRSSSGHIITLDDTSGSENVTITDKGGNQIVLTSSGNEILIESKGPMTFKAGQTLDVEATGKVTIKGAGVVVDGGAATVDVKGSLINLN